MSQVRILSPRPISFLFTGRSHDLVFGSMTDRFTQRSESPAKTAQATSGSRAQGRMSASATGRRRQLTVEEQLQIVARVKNGESQSSIARELGYTRQRISAIMKKHAEVGAEGFVHKKRGRKVGPVPISTKLLRRLRFRVIGPGCRVKCAEILFGLPVAT